MSNKWIAVGVAGVFAMGGMVGVGVGATVKSAEAAKAKRGTSSRKPRRGSSRKATKAAPLCMKGFHSVNNSAEGNTCVSDDYVHCKKPGRAVLSPKYNPTKQKFQYHCHVPPK